MTYILFDIGANYGTNSIDQIRDDINKICFAFEPTPELVKYLNNQTNNFKDRYYIYDYAISDFIGKAKFNIAGQADWGCSSLLEFSDNLDKTWPGRWDFKVTHSIEVNVITLKYFFDEIYPNKIEKIDYFHCDTQGSDLNVLLGMGEYINLIQEGDIEVSANESVCLYKSQQNLKDKTIQFLNMHNFDIINIYPNDHFNNEYNIHFVKIKN